MGGDRSSVGFRVLGPLEIDGLGGQPKAAQQRLLLAALLAVPAQAVGWSVLADVVWEGAPPSDARQGLQVLVARLRRLLATVGVTIDKTEVGYALAVTPHDVDHVRFTEAADRPDTGRQELDDALALWARSTLR